MNYNIVQEFLLNKRNFELKETPQTYYSKSYPLTDNLSVALIIVFKDYNIKFAKYLYYQNKYCCFEVMPEKNHNCKNVTELFEYVKSYDQPISADSLGDQLSLFKTSNASKIIQLQAESDELARVVPNIQRAISMFDRTSPDWTRLANKLNNTQSKLTRNIKEIEILTEVQKELSQFT